jgi:hypothetical protein
MRGIKTILMLPVAAVLLAAAACSGNGYDDGSGPDVVLEVINWATPPVTAATNTAGFCSLTTAIACTGNADCPLAEVCNIGGCTLTVVDWTVGLANLPKNTLAAGPANDIAMIDVTISYNFPLGNPVARTFGLGGQAIPTGGSGSLTFPPIALQDLDPLMVSSTGGLLMTFRGQTVEGTSILLTVARDLTIEECM